MSEKICADCGMIHKTTSGTTSCSGHLRGSGKKTPCRRPPNRGMSVCRLHGGATPVAMEKAAERLALMSAQGEIADLMRDCDIPDQHPVDGLLEVVRVSGSMMRLLTLKVGELTEEPVVREMLVEGKDGSLSTRKYTDGEGFWGLNKDGEMVPSIYVTLLKMWTERYERACETALKAGIEERRIRLAEDTSELFFNALTKAIVEAGLDPVARAALQTALANELRKSNALEVNALG